MPEFTPVSSSGASDRRRYQHHYFSDTLRPFDFAASSLGYAGVANANDAVGIHVRVPDARAIRNVLVWVGVQGAGPPNYDIGVYDSGDASSTVLTRLGTSLGSTAVPTANQWTGVDANIAPGQDKDVFLVIAASSTVFTFARVGGVSDIFNNTPTNYAQRLSGGCPYNIWRIPTSFPLPATLTIASLVGSSINPALQARLA